MIDLIELREMNTRSHNIYAASLGDACVVANVRFVAGGIEQVDGFFCDLYGRDLCGRDVVVWTSGGGYATGRVVSTRPVVPEDAAYCCRGWVVQEVTAEDELRREAARLAVETAEYEPKMTATQRMMLYYPYKVSLVGLQREVDLLLARRGACAVGDAVVARGRVGYVSSVRPVGYGDVRRVERTERAWVDCRVDAESVRARERAVEELCARLDAWLWHQEVKRMYEARERWRGADR